MYTEFVKFLWIWFHSKQIQWFSNCSKITWNSLCGICYIISNVFIKHIHKMAARTTDAAASLSPDRMVFSCFLSCKSQCFCTYSSRLPVFKRAYSREFLLDVGRTTFLELNSAHAEELRDLGLLRRPTPSPTPSTASRPQRRRYKRCERKQKRGKRGGIRARLAANPHKPAIPPSYWRTYALWTINWTTSDYFAQLRGL